MAFANFVVMLSVISCIIVVTLILITTHNPQTVGTSLVRSEKEKSIDPKILEIYRSQVEGRKALFASLSSRPQYYGHLYNVAAPEVFCPGLKIPHPCVIYSMRINNEVSFEQEIYNISKCQIRGFDKVGAQTPHNMVTLLNTLSKSGFYLYQHEINGVMHYACEFSLIHENCLNDYVISCLLTLTMFLSTRNSQIAQVVHSPFHGIRTEKEQLIDPKLLQIYRSQIEGRKLLLASAKTHNYDKVYNVAAPEVFCPGLVRIGGLSDGGKWICNPQKIPHPCVIYSMGISNEMSFEQEIYNISKCQIRGFDMDKMNAATTGAYEQMNATLKVARISEETNESKSEFSFTDLVRMYNHSKIDILKIDIEGGEYDVIDQIIKVPICQILIELHRTPHNMVTLLNTLSKSGFYLYQHEVNGASHGACEFSLIHENCLKDYGVDVVFGRYLS